MSDLTDAVETMMAALSDAMDVWREVGEQIEHAAAMAAMHESEIGLMCKENERLLARIEAIEQRMDRIQAQRAPDFGQMFSGVAGRLNAIESQVVQLKQDVIR